MCHLIIIYILLYSFLVVLWCLEDKEKNLKIPKNFNKYKFLQTLIEIFNVIANLKAN